VKTGLTIRALALVAAMALTPLAAPSVAQQSPSGKNPTADSVNEEALFKQNSKITGRISIPDAKAATLEQPQGREWRGFHEGWMPWIGAIAILGMVVLLAAFYFTKGRIMLERNEHSGRKILRFNEFERFTHWMTATCFIVLALTGLNYVFGKRLLMPLIGPDAFAAISQWSKYAHNFLAWPFMIGICFMMAVWMADNIPNRIDWEWMKAGGGFFSGRHPSAERFNGGQKLVFWIVILAGLLMSISGIMLMFPFAALDINGMQTIQGIHAIIAVLFIAAMLAHIYIGSLGMEGAYDAMGSGEVDLARARAHHDLWVEEQQAKTASGPQVPRRPLPAE
jgi:formate dehydrogenase subunit gamma